MPNPITSTTARALALADAATPGPYEVGLRHAEKLNQHSFAIPIYAGGHRVGTAFGPTMEKAIANAEQLAEAPSISRSFARAIDEADAALASLCTCESFLPEKCPACQCRDRMAEILKLAIIEA